MPIFKSSEQLQEILGGFFAELASDPIIGKKFKESNLVIKFNYKKPDLSITIDCSGEKIEIYCNDSKIKPEVEMFMDADVAHQFWLGKVNLVMALARRQMIAKGHIPKILKLLPVIKPAYKMYPEYIKRHSL